MRLFPGVLAAVLCSSLALAGKPAKAPLNKTADQGGTRYPCPLDKPQKIYGHAINASVVLEKDETWTPDHVYLVFGPFHVKKTLTIQAGTVVCVQYGPPGADGSAEPPPGSIDLEQGAALKVLGTADKHVVFTSMDGPGQYWGGFYFASGAKNELSTMQYVDIYNAGLSASVGVLNTFPDYKAPPLDWQNVTLYSVQRVGLKNLTSGWTPATRILFNNHAEETPTRDLFRGYPVMRVHLWGADTVTEQTLRLGPTVARPARYVQLDHAEGMHIDADVTLHKLADGMAWRNIGNMKMNGPADDPALFTIDPGVILAVNNGGYINIGNGGTGMANLVAVGTKDQPIVFTSDAFTEGREPERGDWPAIEFFPGNFNPRVSKFEWVTFEYGGGMGKDSIYNCNDGRSDRTATLLFTISGKGEDYEGPQVKNSTFRKSGGAGVRCRCNVGHSGGCLKTNYEDKALGNKFEDVDEDHPATMPLSCPAN